MCISPARYAVGTDPCPLAENLGVDPERPRRRPVAAQHLGKPATHNDNDSNRNRRVVVSCHTQFSIDH
ncbi:hypothetical protein G352_19096 [Rhodococcus ruber BKS 20-38]|uniref:Uncharacterized protein n=1 Tax=Rhodococcus ruber BKS 20-38 TaxID=1278076 RepID=M2XI23_9NOCA|nr:hypothetical protein G352_19096 [Rhodococcus ruber BKS 20-38]